MRAERVLTNVTCNQNCSHCVTRRPEEDRAFAAPAAVRLRIEQAIFNGAAEIELAGGEPMLRRDILDLVAHAKAAGALRIALRTNATAIDEAAAVALRQAGLEVVRVHLPAVGDALDAISRDPGGWERTRGALHALRRAGVELQLRVPIVRANLQTAPEIPAALALEGLADVSLLVGAPHLAPEPSVLASAQEAVSTIERLENEARRECIDVRMDTESFIPPCLFTRREKLARIYALNQGALRRDGYEQIETCSSCTVRDRCPGVPVRWRSASHLANMRAIDSSTTRRQLTVIESREAQIARELFQDEYQRQADGQLVPARVVRVLFQCNQACQFCFVSTHLPAADEQLVLDAIEQIARRNGVVMLSGGEPTLHPRLPSFVQRAREWGAREIELQTNATRMAEPGLIDALTNAGLDRVFVSLHGVTAETSDAITQAPGTFDKTVAGLDALAQSSLHVRVNFVLCEPNRTQFPDLVDLAATRWPRADVAFSFVAASTDLVPHSSSLIPRYTDVMPLVAAGLDRAARRNVRVHGFESMCGLPLCFVPDTYRRVFLAMAELPEGADGGEFVRGAACASCSLSTRCFGVRRRYAELYGTHELRSVGEMNQERSYDETHGA